MQAYGHDNYIEVFGPPFRRATSIALDRPGRRLVLESLDVAPKAGKIDRMHYYGHSKDAPVATPNVYRDHSHGYTQAPLITHTSGSVHTGTSLNFLAPGGFIAPHLHSFEVGVYILEGEVVLGIGPRAYKLVAGRLCGL